jgi:hypothetical protein
LNSVKSVGLKTPMLSLVVFRLMFGNLSTHTRSLIGDNSNWGARKWGRKDDDH